MRTSDISNFTFDLRQLEKLIEYTLLAERLEELGPQIGLEGTLEVASQPQLLSLRHRSKQIKHNEVIEVNAGLILIHVTFKDGSIALLGLDYHKKRFRPAVLTFDSQAAFEKNRMKARDFPVSL